MKYYPVSRKQNIVIEETSGEILIYDLAVNKAFCLNETSAIVWQLCDGSNSVKEISKELAEKLNTSVNEEIVWLALDQLEKERLIEERMMPESPFVGLSRREIIKKVGLGTMIAMPIISSVVAPTGVMAQSGCLAVGESMVSLPNLAGNCGGSTQAARDAICQGVACPGLTCSNTGTAPTCTGGVGGVILVCTCV